MLNSDVRRKPIPKEWEPYLDRYLQHCVVAGRAKESIRSYSERLGQIARHLGGSPLTVEPDAFVDFLSTQTWSKSTRKSRYETYRGFWGWLTTEEKGIENLPATLPTIPAAEPRPNPIPYGMYLEALVRADARTRLILRLAGEHGARRTEIALAHTRDLVPTDNGWSLWLHGKRGKSRLVPLNEDLGNYLPRMPEGYFFPGRIDGHLSPRRVYELASFTLPAGWTLHKLRHMFASRAYSVTRDLVAIQELLGHASIQTTRAYIAIDDQALRDVVQSIAVRSFSKIVDKRMQDAEHRYVRVDLERITPSQALNLITILGKKISGFPADTKPFMELVSL